MATAFHAPFPTSIAVGRHNSDHGDLSKSPNAVAETINGLYKAEVIHRRAWKNRESVEPATLDWVDWFNHCRLLAPIGHIPPAEAEAIYYQQLTESAVAA